jgi:phage FluMu protein Com
MGTTSRLRCDTCGMLLAELVTSPYQLYCRRCRVKVSG